MDATCSTLPNLFLFDSLAGACVPGERERYYTFPALRLMQVLPGHAPADSTEHIKQKVAAIEDGCNTRTSQHCPANTRICISQGSKPKKHT